MESLLIPGTYLIPGIGEVVITAALAILVGKAAIEAGTEIYNSVQQGLQIHFSKEAEEAKKDIPERLKDEDGNVDLGKFDQKVKGKSAKKEEGGWEIEKDTSEYCFLFLRNYFSDRQKMSYKNTKCSPKNDCTLCQRKW